MSEKSDDLQILKKFNNGDISAFEELVLKYQDRIYNLCRHMLDNAHDAEDAAQDTFIKAYQKLKDFKPEASCKGTIVFSAILYYHLYKKLTGQRGCDMHNFLISPSIASCRCGSPSPYDLRG